MAAPEVSIVVPTYCEGQNLGVLIPAIADVVTEVNLGNRRMTVDPLPGLLDR